MTVVHVTGVLGGEPGSVRVAVYEGRNVVDVATRVLAKVREHNETRQWNIRSLGPGMPVVSIEAVTDVANPAVPGKVWHRFSEPSEPWPESDVERTP